MKEAFISINTKRKTCQSMKVNWYKSNLALSADTKSRAAEEPVMAKNKTSIIEGGSYNGSG